MVAEAKISLNVEKESGNLEAELVTLVTEVFALLMTVVTVHAVQLILIVRREMRILGLDILGLFNQSLDRMTLLTVFDARRLEVLFIRTVANRAVRSELLMTVRKIVGSLCIGNDQTRQNGQTQLVRQSHASNSIKG